MADETICSPLNVHTITSTIHDINAQYIHQIMLIKHDL